MRRARTFGPAGLLALLVSLGCSRGSPLEELSTARFRMAAGGTSVLDGLLGAKATVFITLDPECPFSQAYTTLLDSLARVSAPRGIAFVGYYPGAFFQAADVAMFAARSGLSFPQVMDADCALANALEARVTPEVFVVDADRRMVYHGAIDDSAVRAGRKKPEATKHYLADVLEHVAVGRAVEQKEVTAVGCIVECR